MSGYFDDLDKVPSVHAVFPGELTIMLRQWLGNVTYIKKYDFRDLPKAARQWFNRYGVRYPGVDGTLYRGLKNKKGGVKWLINALDSGRVNLRKNDLESWSYSFDTARHFMIRQDTGPVRERRTCGHPSVKGEGGQNESGVRFSFRG